MSEEAMGLDGGIFSVGIGEQPPSRRGLLRRAQQPPGRQSSGRTARPARATGLPRSEEHTSELQSLMRISYAVFCLKKKNNQKQNRSKTNAIIYEVTYQHT